MDEFMAFVRGLDGLPLHTLLIYIVIVLWRKVNALEKSLEECLRGNAKQVHATRK